MKNGKEYCLSIRQQIVELLEKARLNVEERAVLDQLDFGMRHSFSYRCTKLQFR